MDLQKRRALRIWQRLEEAFGNGRWRALRGQDPPGIWLAGVAMLTDDEVRHGLRAIVTEWPGTDDPPTWPQFRDLCRPRDGRTPEQRVRDARIAREQPERLALPGAALVVASMPARWLGWRVRRGHVPMPTGWTDADVDQALDGADLATMDAEVLAHRQGEASARGMDIDDLPGASPGPWLRAAP